MELQHGQPAETSLLIPQKLSAAIGLLALLATTPYLALAQTAAQQPLSPAEAAKRFSFFVTSEGAGNGADLGGLAGADAHCQKLANAAVANDKTWRAYLSTQALGGQSAVNARDRIGQGPWYNVRGALIAKNLSQLHGDTLDEARLGNDLSWASAFTEKNEAVKRAGDKPNEHDILTGSLPDGRAFTDAADRRTWFPPVGLACSTASR